MNTTNQKPSIEQTRLEQLKALIGKPTSTIETPALVLDFDAAMRNMQRMAEFAEKHKLRLRPHAKLHKSARIAMLQIQAGAIGLTTQTITEAEALAAAGVNDILISNQIISIEKLRRVAALAYQIQNKKGKLGITIDSLEGIKQLVHAMQITSRARINVYIEINIGQNRCGVNTADEAIELAKQIKQHPQHLNYAGLHAYNGAAQHIKKLTERREAIKKSAQKVQEIKTQLEKADLTPPIITGGGTGTFGMEAASGHWHEIQAGSFLCMDAHYLQNERDPAQPAFEPALFIKTQIISQQKTHAVCDAGHKSHAIESGMPIIYNPATYPETQINYTNGGDEHGILTPKNPAHMPKLGTNTWLIPGHSDPTINLHPHIYIIEATEGDPQKGRIKAVIPIQGRGIW